MVEDLLEADGSARRENSLKKGQNVQIRPTGVFENRQGSFYKRTLSDAGDIFGFQPNDTDTFGALVNDASLQIINQNSQLVVEFTSVPWTSAAGIWLEDLRDILYIGGQFGIYGLQFDGTNWSFGQVQWTVLPGGEIAQPYWAYEPGVTLQPSATTGAITLTASAPVFDPLYVGQRIRYAQREINVTSFISPTAITGTVISSLPQSREITISTSGKDTSFLEVGEVVIGADSGFQGIITTIVSSTNFRVVPIANIDGLTNGEKLSSPSLTFDFAADPPVVAPEGTTVWDEPLMSPYRGFPRSAAAASGRLFLVNFPSAPNVVAGSSTRAFTDFSIGLDDDDAIVRNIGDGKPSIRHAVAAGDLLLLTDQGLYYVRSRDNIAITPSSFEPVRFDERGASAVAPARFDDGVIFVEASGQSVAVARLSGNVYLNWVVQNLTQFHEHLISSPVKVCGPSFAVSESERYVFVVNADGTAACASFIDNGELQAVGFVPWVTSGQYINVSPVFDGYYAIVDRDIGGSTVRFLEKFDANAYLDCATEATGAFEALALRVNDAGDTLATDGGDRILFADNRIAHMAGATVDYYGDLQYGGTHVVNSDGTVTNPPTYTGSYQVGFKWVMDAQIWPKEVIESPRIGMIEARVVRFGVSVQQSLGFKVDTNNSTLQIDAYKAGDNLTLPPIRRDEVYRFTVLGRRDHPLLRIHLDTPGPLRVLATIQEVQA